VLYGAVAAGCAFAAVFAFPSGPSATLSAFAGLAFQSAAFRAAYTSAVASFK